MRLRRLHLEQYRPFERVEFEFGDNVTLLVGPNNCGKSAALRAIDRFAAKGLTQSDLRAGATSPVVVEGVVSIRPGPSVFRELPDASELLVRYFIGDGPFVTRAIASNSSGVTCVLIDDPKGIRMGSGGVVNLVASALIAFQKRTLFLTHDRAPTLTAPLRAADSLTPDFDNLVHVMLSLQSNEQARLTMLQKRLAELVPGIGTVGLRTKDGSGTVVVRDNGVERPLEDLGAGVAHLLAILIALTEPERKNALLLVDEPEMTLHPAGQRALYSMMRDSGSQVVAATHSAVFIQESPPDAVYMFSNGTFRRFETPPREALEAIGLRASDLAAAGEILLVEGPSDIQAYASLARRLGHPLRYSTRLCALGTGNAFNAKTTLGALDSLFSRLPVPALCILDRDERPERQLAALAARKDIYILKRRELENYFLDPKTLVAYLATHGISATEHDINSRLNNLPLSIFHLTFWKALRSQVPRLTQPLLTDDANRLLAGLAGTPSKASDACEILLATIARLPHELGALVTETGNALFADMLTAWNDPTQRLVLFPGEEILNHVLSGFGRKYTKTRDAESIIACLQNFDTELVELATRMATFGVSAT